MNTKLMIPGALLGLLSLGACYVEDPNGCSDCSPTLPQGSLDTDLDQDGYSEEQGDCNDSDASIHPNAGESNDGADNDCDGNIDEGLNQTPTPVDGPTATPGNGATATPGDEPTPTSPMDTPTAIPATPTATPDPVEVDPDIVLDSPSDGGSTVISDLRWVGDLDGDGYDDIAASVQTGTSGRVHIYYGSESGLNLQGDLEESADATITGIADPDTNGVRLGVGGDVNGDGYDDLLLGDVYHRRVVLYMGGPSRMAGEITQDDATAIFNSFEQGSYAVGMSMAIVPDMNKDGKDEIAIGVPAFNLGKGQLALFYGRDGFSGVVDVSHADTHFLGVVETGATGSQVFGLSDLDGDGFGDLGIVSSNVPLHYNSIATGTLSVYYGSETLAEEDVNISSLAYVASPPSASMVGMSLDTGDMDGDGKRDIVVGLPTDGTSHGRAFVLFGDGNRLSGLNELHNAASNVWGMDDGDFAFGSSVALAGDITGNGKNDLVVTSPLLLTENAAATNGSAFPDPGDIETRPGYGVIFAGKAQQESYDSATDAWGYINAGQLGYDALWPVVSGGDVNGDGKGDLLIGATAFTEGGGSKGALLVLTE